jgi:hypothetical protein
MPLLFAAKKALTVEVRAPLPPHRDRPPSLANLERPGNEGRYGPVGESIGWVETPEPLTWGYTPFLGSAGASLSRLTGCEFCTFS